MIIKKLVLACIMASALLMPGVSVAQDNQQSSADTTGQGAKQQRQAAQNWLKICEPLDDGEKACLMRRVVSRNGRFLGSFVLRNDPGQKSRLTAVAALPLGVFIPFGMTWKIDSGQPSKFLYLNCDATACYAVTPINENFVNALKQGAKLHLSGRVMSQAGIRDLVVDIDLDNFTATYNSDEALTFDEYQQRSTGSAALERALDSTAKKLRSGLNVSDSGSGASDSAAQ